MSSKFTVETDIEQKTCDLAWKHLGIVGSKLRIVGDTGYNDRIFWLPGGRPLLIEFKRPGDEPRPKQVHIHKQLLKLGYEVEVHDNSIKAFQAIIKVLESSPISEEGRKILIRARSRSLVL